jgi:hypothetical protein
MIEALPVPTKLEMTTCGGHGRVSDALLLETLGKIATIPPKYSDNLVLFPGRKPPATHVNFKRNYSDTIG